MNKLFACFLTLCVINSATLFAQGVHLSNEDPRWGETITVSYSTGDSSAFAQSENEDTLYCAAIIRGVHPSHAIIVPMKHINGPSYQTKLTIPDSTNSVWLEIVVPTNRIPNGIDVFTCRTRDGRPTPGYNIGNASSNIDSALDADLKLYPRHYTSFVSAYDHARELQRSGENVMPDSAWRPWVNSLIERLKATPDNTASWYLALGALYSRERNDSLANIEFQNAARTHGFDPIFNDENFWNYFFAPRMAPGGKGMTWPIIPGRNIAPLVERNPRTDMAALWLQRMGFDTLLTAVTYRQVSEAWSSSKDVDVLRAIAQAYGFEKSPLYNPTEALKWNDRAEESSKSFASFFSGDNIWGSMDRMPHIIAEKIYLLGKLGRIDEAALIARAAMQTASQIRDKQEIGGELANAYFETGRIEDAKREYGTIIALGTGGYISGLSEFYSKYKQGNETEQEFSAHLAKEYGGSIELPKIPDFSFTTLDGMHGTLAALKGKVVVLDCWFVSCPGCIIEKNSLNKLVESFHGDTNVVFLSIATDDEKAVRSFLQHSPSKFEVVANGYDICERLGVTGYPTHILIGKDGKTLGYEMGGSEHEDELMRPKIEQALGKM